MTKLKRNGTCVSVFSTCLAVILLLDHDIVVANSVLRVADQACPASCECQGNMTVITCSNMDTIEHIDIPPTVNALNLGSNFLNSDFTLSSRNIPDLKMLDLSNNVINHLQGSAFINLRKLTHLILRNNDLQTLDDDTFRETIKLEVLDLSYNRFDSIPDKPFRHLVNLKTLNISYNRIDFLVFGLRFQVLTRLEMLDFSGNPLGVVRSGAFEMAILWEDKIQRHFNLSFCELRAVESHAFTIPGLMSLSLAGNPDLTPTNLSEIVQELHITKIRKIDLSYMNISNMNQVFMGPEQFPVIEISLANNEITEIPGNVSYYMQHVERLHLQHNNISLLGQPISELVRLKYLDVSHNSIEQIYVNLSKTLTKLETLILSHNNISEMDIVLGEFSKLKYLDLNSNKLSSIVIPSDLIYLEYINVAKNQISSHNTFTGLPVLRFFDISSNLLTSLNSFFFVGAPLIEIANFSQNHLNAISHQAFRPCTPHIIDLSFNKLTRIMNCGWQETKVLHLQNNLISNIDRRTFHNMMALKYLDMSANNVTYVWEDMFMFLTNLTELFLQGNNLSLWPKTLSKLLRPLKKLHKIDLSLNEIEELDETVFGSFDDLFSLSLSNNKLRYITSDVFSELSSLEYLDITNNPFDCGCDMIGLQRWIRNTNVRLINTYNTSYMCSQPAQLADKTIMEFEVDLFQCQTILLYVTVIGSIGGFLIVVVALTTSLCHYYHKCRQSKIEKTKAKVLKYLNMNGQFLHMEPLSNGVNGRIKNGNIPSVKVPRQTDELQGRKLSKSQKQKNKKRSYSLETGISNRTAKSRRLSALFPLKSNLKNKKCRRFSDTGDFESKGVRFRHRPYSRSHQPSVDLGIIGEAGSRAGRRVSADHHKHEKRNYRNSRDGSAIFAKGNQMSVNSDVVRYPYPPRLTDSMPDMVGNMSSVPRMRRSRLPLVHVDSKYSKTRSRSWVEGADESTHPYMKRKFSSLDRPIRRIQANETQTLGRRRSRPSIGSRSVYI